jgi:hypothetical protein
MKKLNSILYLSLFVFLTVPAISENNAFNTSPNRYSNTSAEEAEIYASFAEIDAIVTYVETNENITYTDLEATEFSLTSLSTNSALALFPDEEGDNRFYFNNQTAFFMGCVFGMIGILAVAIVNNGNNSVINSSIWGCVASGCVSGGSVIAIYVFYFAAFAGFYY